MQLSNFISGLLNEGSVVVEPKISDYSQEDMNAGGQMMRDYYTAEVNNLPHDFPALKEEAAFWSAQFVLRFIQLLLNRDYLDDDVDKYLEIKHFETEEEIFSVDLFFRYFDQLLKATKAYSPNDYLIERLKVVLRKYPFSSFGILKEDEFEGDINFENKGLQTEYATRVLKYKEVFRIDNENIKETIREVIGNQKDLIAPNVDLEEKI